MKIRNVLGSALLVGVGVRLFQNRTEASHKRSVRKGAAGLVGLAAGAATLYFLRDRLTGRLNGRYPRRVPAPPSRKKLETLARREQAARRDAEEARAPHTAPVKVEIGQATELKAKLADVLKH